MISFKKIPYEDCKDIILNKHYAGRMPSISFSYGCFKDDELIGVLTIGKPASHQLCIGVCGKDMQDKVFELNRLCLLVEEKNLASRFVSYALKDLKPLDLIIVSYADTAMGHLGTIYQATNFIYTGKTKSRTDIFSGNGKHSRHYDKNEKQKYRVVRSSKHRYIYFTGSKKFKKSCMKKLRYTIEGYPSGESERYTLGYKLEQKLIKV